MTACMPEPSAAHRAALTLHSLAGADRAWVLQALVPEQQATLESLLQELHDLGIPMDAGLLNGVVASQPGASPPGVAALQELRGAMVLRLASVLAAEPPRVIAALLASRPWPWREQLLAALPSPLAAEIDRLTTRMAAAGALQSSAVAEIARCMEATGAEQAAPSKWQTIRQTLAALRRRA
jgi:hypothetical protein